MSERKGNDLGQDLQGRLAKDLASRIARILDAAAGGESVDSSAEFDHVLSRMRELFRARLIGKGGRRDTGDLLGEMLFSRLKAAFRELFAGSEWMDPLKAAENLLAVLVSSSTCGDFAAATERILDEAAGAHKEAFSFAGLTDFISVEEVLQLLGSGKHSGCLTLEKEHNRLAIYFQNGRIAFLDPRRLLRRVLPSRDAMNCREIPEATMRAVNAAHDQNGTPIVLLLNQHGVFRDSEVREACRILGTEVLFEFLQEDNPATFAYKRLLELPEFVRKYDLRLGVTPVLLEGSKRLDEMRSLSKVFPDLDQPLQLPDDMFARLGELNLQPLELKLLAMANDHASPRSLSNRVGLPLLEILQVLVKFARVGIVDPPAGAASLLDVSGNIEESMAMAFEALEANDDKRAVNNALDKAFGFDDGPTPKRRAGGS